MAIVALPDNEFRTIEWSLDTPTQINRSEWSGARRVWGLPGRPRWTFSAEHVPIIGEAAFRPWRGFLAALRGPVNVFRMIAVEAPQHALTNPATTTANAAGVAAVQLSGLPVSAQLLPAGAMMTIPLTNGDEQLVMLTAALSGNASGIGTAAFQPPLRGATAAFVAVETIRPAALVAIDGTANGWSVDQGQIYRLALTGSEAF